MFDAPVFIAPGISATPSQGTVSHSGSITCIGSIHGHEITGPGRLEESGTYSGSCAEGTGEGNLTLTLPTTEGQKTLEFTDTIEWTGTFGRFQSEVLSGTFQFVPTQGDCVTRPVTRAHLVAQGVLQG